MLRFLSTGRRSGDPMRDTQFKVASAIVMQEITSQLRPADPRHEDWARRERDILGALRADYLKAAADQITSLARNLSQFARISHSFRRALSGLEMTRIMCEIERVKLTGDTAGLDEITDQLKHTEQEMSAAMERIETIVAHLSTAAHDLKQKGIADRQGEAA